MIKQVVDQANDPFVPKNNKKLGNINGRNIPKPTLNDRMALITSSTVLKVIDLLLFFILQYCCVFFFN